MLFVLYLIVLCEILGHLVSGLRYPIDILFHPPVFPAPRTTRSLRRIGCCYCFHHRLVFLSVYSYP